MTHPQVEDRITDVTSSNATTHNLLLPTNSHLFVGQKLLLSYATDGVPGQSGEIIDDPDWVLFDLVQHSTNSHRMWTFERVIDGSEGPSVQLLTGNGQHVGSIALRLSNAGALDKGVASGVEGSDANPNPGEVIPTGGAKDYLALALMASDGGRAATGAPSGYSNLLNADTGAATDGVAIASAEKLFNAVSEDPGAFTIDNPDQWVARTIIVHPAEAIHELPRATETDTARALSVAKTVTLPRATSTDVARDLVASRTYELPRASETDSAHELVVSTADVHQLTRAVETDVARALTATKTVVLPRATETDTARALTVTGEVLLPRALETNLARALSGVAPRRPARRRALISTVAFTIGGKEIHIDGWRARSRINYGYEHLTGTLQGADARCLGQGDRVIAWIESTGEPFWEGRLALDPTVHDGEAPIACAGDGVVLEKSGGRALFQTRDMSLLVDEANLPHDYAIDPGISVSTEPGMLHMEVGANVTPTGAGHGLLLWAPGQRFTRYVLGRIRLQAHGTTGHKLQVLGGLGPAGALTEIADHSLTSGDTSNYATNIAGDYDLLVFRFDPSTTTASGPRWVDIVDVRINGFGTADTLGASELVAEMGRRAGLDVSKVTANGLNVLPRDHRDGPWRTLLEDVAVFTGWQFGVYDGLHFGPYGDRTWTVYRSYGGDPELDLLEKFNRFVIHYPTANGVPAEVVRDSSPNPLPPGVVNVFEETISEVQPDDSFPTAVAAQLDADLSSDRRAGQVHVVAAHDDAGRRQLLLMRPGHHLRFGDWGPYESRTFPVHDLEASAEGLMLGTNAPARVDRLIANTMLERARSVPFRFTSHAPR